jgi:ribosome-binding ATPase YchF (GTP1/OBG family)
MKAGIVGLPNVGKSTLFNCLSMQKRKVLTFRFVQSNPILVW